ncbi:MAG TPA: FAD-dependent monooxygenase [Candidatus Nitrosotenuis sp.]|nr:FAD-dependent monooxygenase [Candidatus Nitrosotenuis sp.]
MTAPVAILGAGPAGLALACALSRLEVPCALFDEAPGPDAQGPPLTLCSRSLEMLHRWGLTRAALARGLPLRRARFTLLGHTFGYLPTSELPSQYPFLLCLEPRDLVELLAAGAARAELRWGQRVKGLRQVPGGLELWAGDGRQRFRWVAVTRPWLRERLEMPLEPGTAPPPAWTARVAPEPETQYAVHLHPRGLARVLPCPGGPWHLTLQAFSGGEEAPGQILAEMGLDFQGLEPVELPSAVGVAPLLALESVFLLGPGAHSGGRGVLWTPDLEMAEAENLAWKLAAVLRGAPPALLETYDLERRPVARASLELLDRLSPLLSRARLMRRVAPTLRAAFVRKALGLQIGGLAGTYPPSFACLESEPPGPWARQRFRRGAGAGQRCPEVRFVDGQGRRRWLHDLLGQHPVVLRFDGEQPGAGFRVSRTEQGPMILHDPEGSLHEAFAAGPGSCVALRPDGVVGYRAWREAPGGVEAYLENIWPSDPSTPRPGGFTSC